MPYKVVPAPQERDMIQTIDRLNDEHGIVIIDLEGTASMTSRAWRDRMVLIPFNQSPVDAECAANAVELIDEEAEALGRKIPFRLVRSRDSAAIATKTSKRIANAIVERNCRCFLWAWLNGLPIATFTNLAQC
jgi:chromosome partitioning protein